MKTLSSAQIRQKFLDYFARQGHQIVSSSSLIPANDPTLLFTNAGMVPFKEVFLGQEHRNYTRATSSQRCVRAGGKHNDLENVGFTARHHTFFEMLGNFSFGDYFKREAIQFAWDFLTRELKLPIERLWVTVFTEDQETESIWLDEMKIDPARFSRCGEKDNFWSMGETGPCGPCTEIFYDHGPEVAGGPPGTPEEDGDRYVEIWNLVFMQYERQSDGELKPLPNPSVDTGMGLERIAAVMQGVHSNYEIDLFQQLIQKTAGLTQTKDLTQNSLKVIADHIRSCAFLIVDGVLPSNEGRGYVLRRIIRRAVRHGYKLGVQREPFFYKLVPTLVSEMGQAYPELTAKQGIVEKALLKEEEQFAQTLEHGLGLLEQDIQQLTTQTISGETLFKLYDTYGFPVDLTADIAREKGLAVDEAGFERCMQEQRIRSQQSSQFTHDYTQDLQVTGSTEFTGYETLEDEGKVIALLQAGQEGETLQQGQQGCLVLSVTPFYAEAGGQVGDQGVITAGEALFEVSDTKKVNSVYLHFGVVKQGEFHLQQKVQAQVQASARRATMLNHSATHLLHAALYQVLGAHVVQKGSLVEPERLRFDFSHFEPVTAVQLQEIERLVNEQIRANHQVEINITTLEEAKEAGVTALFGEKYGDWVRVLRMGDFSQELCGGTHVKRTGDIGFFKIINESGIASGVRRIEAVTGEQALAYVEELEGQLKACANQLKTSPEMIVSKAESLQTHLRQLERQVEQLQVKLTSGAGGTDLASQAQEVAGIQVLAANLGEMDSNGLRHILDQMKNKLGQAVVILASIKNDKIQLVAGVSKNLLEQIKAPAVLNHVAQQVGGKGGGRPDMAQGGGSEVAKLDEALASVPEWLKQQLNL